MKIVNVKIEDIKYYQKNSKKHPDEQINKIANSIEEFGFNVPVILDKNNILIAGHGRVIAARGLDISEIPCIYKENLTKEQVIAYRIMDNKSAESDWDLDILKGEFESLQLEDFDLSLTGFDIDEISLVMGEEEVEEDDFEPDKAYDKAKESTITIARGEIFMLGNHRLMCGDSTNEEDILLLTNDKIMDILFTDPPYGLGGYAGRSGKFKPIEGDEKNPSIFYNNLPTTIPERYIWANWNVLRIIKEEPRDVIVWKKNNFGMGRGYRGQYEICLYYGTFKGSDSDVWEIDKDTHYEHPTQKPIKLAARAFKNSPGTNVLDLFGGSGSTLIACEQTNRKCFMMEIDPVYVEVICQRWEKLTGKLRVKIN